MRKARKNTATRQVIHIVGEGLTELFYFSHLKKILGYRYSISPRLFENNSIEKIDKKIKELLDEDVFVICVFDADVSRRSDAENKKMVSLKKKYENIIRKSKFPQNPKRSVRFSGKRTKRSVQKRKARNTQKAETKVL